MSSGASLPQDPSRSEVERLFSRALDLPSDQRRSWLDSACRGRSCLRDEVESLLAAAAGPPSLLEKGWRVALKKTARPSEVEKLPCGGRIGAYRLLSLVGQGGMGAIYRARREDGQIEHEVAIKILRQDLETEVAHRRFQEERQILSGLNHPNIARFFDGGRTPDGRPYLVMELVLGQPLMVYCERSRLGLRRRLALFRTVCRAVEHAHRNLVVHRDLKPSNVLVTADGTVKLLDFGIAKLLREGTGAPGEGAPGEGAPGEGAPGEGAPGEGAPGWDLTRDHRPLTPGYAAPEQMLGQRISTATDVYALGIVLYELLTGLHPILSAGEATFSLRPWVEAEPPFASVALTALSRREGSSGKRRLAEISARRRTTPRNLIAKLRGDLDWILAKALARDPEARYPTAAALARDLLRHAYREPVEARPGTPGYRARRFFRRHWLASLGAALVALSLATGALAAWQGRLQAERARDRSEHISDFLLEMFDIEDPSLDYGDRVTARELLDAGAARIKSAFSTEPRLEADLSMVIGRAYQHLGMSEPAIRWMERGVEKSRAAYGDDSVEVALARVRLGDSYRDVAAHPQVIREYFLAARASLEARDPDHPSLVETLNALAQWHHAHHELDEALALYQRAMILHEKHTEKADLWTVTLLNNLGNLYRDRGDRDSSDAYHRQALTTHASLPGARPGFRAQLLMNYSALEAQRGDLAAAEETMLEVHRLLDGLYSLDHPLVANAWNQLGFVRFRRGDIEGARTAFEKTREILVDRLPENHFWRLQTALNLAVIARVTGAPAACAARLRPAVELLRGQPKRAGDLARFLHELGLCARDAGDFAEARAHVSEAHKICAEIFGPEHRETRKNREELRRMEESELLLSSSGTD